MKEGLERRAEKLQKGLARALVVLGVLILLSGLVLLHLVSR